MPAWVPDWKAMLREAPEITVPARHGHVYLIADAHLGDERAPGEAFSAMLRRLPRAEMIVFLGDLFKVWLALPRYWERQVRAVLDTFQEVRATGTPVVFVAGNREYFLPRNKAEVAIRGLPFDEVITGAGYLRFGRRRYGLTHGDVVNRRDEQYLKWRRFSRSRGFEWVFRSMPGGMARRVAAALERQLAQSNRQIKITYPADELQAFARTVLTDVDGFFIGHFHRDETVTVPERAATLRIVPDWFSRRQLVRLAADGRTDTLTWQEGKLVPTP